MLRSSILLLGCALCCAASFSLSAAPKDDGIPRTRLVTDRELLLALDFSRKELLPVASALADRDTALALSRFADILHSRRSPRFFFATEEVESRVKLFQRTYPAAADRALRSADDFMKTYGADVDWRVPGTDRKGRPHTPNTVRLLARQWQAENIALAYFLRGHDRRYLDFFRAHVSDFVHDYESGRTQTGGNDIFERFYAGHRTRNWLMACALLEAAPEFSSADRILMAKVFLLHAARLYDVCRKFNWGNHQLVGLTGLYEASLMHPEFSVMRAWNARATELITEHAQREINPDGFQFERASHYFKLDITNYFVVQRLATLNDTPLPPVVNERFHRMFDAIAAMARPDGSLPVLQDAQDSYVSGTAAQEAREGLGEARSENAAELAEPEEDVFMSLGAVLYGDSSYRYFGGKKFPSAFFWMLDTTVAAKYDSLPPTAPVTGSTALTATGYYVMRSGWDRDARYLVIDGGLAHDKPDHTHGGVLGVSIYAYGEDVVPVYRVKYSDPSYPQMKNSLVKNVALADTLLQGRGWKPNEAGTGFGIWRSLPTPTVHAWVTGRTADWFSAGHNGFEPIGVSYSRSVLFLKPNCWLFVDAFSSSAPHSARQIWQGTYESQSAGIAVGVRGKARIRIVQSVPDKLRCTAHRVAETSSIWFEAAPSPAQRFVTLVDPQAGGEKIESTISARKIEGGDAYDVTRGAMRATVVLGKMNLWKEGEVFSDASVAVRRTEEAAASSIVALGMTTWDSPEFSLRSEHPISIEAVAVEGGNWSFHLLEGDAQTLRIAGGDGAFRHCEISVRGGVTVHLPPRSSMNAPVR